MIFTGINALLEEGLSPADFEKIGLDKKLARKIVDIVKTISKASKSVEEFVGVFQKREKKADELHAGFIKTQPRNTKVR